MNSFRQPINQLLALAFLWAMVGNLCARNPVTDSLEKILATNPQGEARVNLLIDLCVSMYYTEPSLVMQYSEEAYHLSEELGMKLHKAEAAIFLAWGNRVTGNHPQAIEYGYEAQRIGQELDNREIQGKALFVLGTVQIDEGNYPDSERLFYDAKEMLEGTEALVELGLTVNGIGEIRRHRKQFDEALEAYQEASEWYKKAGFDRGLIITTNNMGMVYLARGEYEKARKFLSEARKKGLKENFVGVILESTDGIAKSYLAQGNIEKAQVYADSALASAKYYDFTSYIKIIAETLTEIYKKKGDYKQAMEYQELFYNSVNLLKIEETQNKIAGLNYEFELKEKEAAMREMEAQNEVMQKGEQVRRLALFTMIGFLGLALIMIFLQVRANRQKQQANALLSNQNERLEELNREKDSLVGIVAHDLKAPLTKVQSLARMLEMIGGLSEQQEDVIQKIEKVTQDGSRLIQDLLDITRAETSQRNISRSEFELNELLRNLVEGHQGHAKRKSIQLEFLPAEGKIEMYSEESFLSRIFDNILSNALKYSPSGKKVIVRTKLEKGTASFYIKDEGPGISEEDQAKMFRKFQKLTARPTAGESSTGLGLAIIKMLVEKLDGIIEVNSKLGEGSEFVVYVPTGKG